MTRSQVGELLNRRDALTRLSGVAASMAGASLAFSQIPDPPPANKSRILLTYVWRDTFPGGNIGDFSITPGLIALLQRELPDFQPTALTSRAPRSGAPFEVRRDVPGFPGCDLVSDYLGAVEKTVLARNPDWVRAPGEEGDARTILTRTEQHADAVIAELERTAPEFLELFRRLALVIYNSGMILVYGPGTLARDDFWGYSVRRSLPLLVARRLGVPYGVYAHSFDSFGPADGPAATYFRRLLEDAKFVFCRDGDSVRYLKQLGFQARNLMFVPDSTLSFPGRDDRWAESFLQQHQLQDQQFLTVIPRTYRGGGFISGAIGEERSLAQLAKLRSLIVRWVQETGLPAVVAAEVANDLPNARELVHEALPEEVRNRCIMLPKFWSTDQAAALYARSRAVVTMELHSFLMAIPQGTPTLVTTFRESGRKVEMPADFLVPDWGFDIDSTQEFAMQQRLLELHRENARSRERIQHVVLPHLRKLEQQALDTIRASLPAQG